MKLFHSLAIASLGLLFSAAALAQTPPSAGSLNEQIQRELSERPVDAAPDLRIEQDTTTATPAASSVRVLSSSNTKSIISLPIISAGG